jgi:hypothetical protein
MRYRSCLWVILFAPILWSASAVADVPPMKTIVALALEEGWKPDLYDPATHLTNLDKDIPRDFPLPAASHHLVASNAVPAASVSGTPAQVEAFYSAVLPSQGWTIKKHLKFPGSGAEPGPGRVTFIACKAGQCVNLSSSSKTWDAQHPDLIKLLFFKE